MPLVLNGDGSIQSLVPGGLPDATITQADLDTATSFAGTKTANGYQKLPNGLILQWATGVGSVNANQTITYPISFPTAVISLICSGKGVNASSNAIVSEVSKGTSSCVIQSFDQSNGSLAVTPTIFVVGY